jgi:hypothetical protein
MHWAFQSPTGVSATANSVLVDGQRNQTPYQKNPNTYSQVLNGKEPFSQIVKRKFKKESSESNNQSEEFSPLSDVQQHPFVVTAAGRRASSSSSSAPPPPTAVAAASSKGNVAVNDNNWHRGDVIDCGDSSTLLSFSSKKQHFSESKQQQQQQQREGTLEISSVGTRHTTGTQQFVPAHCDNDVEESSGGGNRICDVIVSTAPFSAGAGVSDVGVSCYDGDRPTPATKNSGFFSCVLGNDSVDEARCSGVQKSRSNLGSPRGLDLPTVPQHQQSHTTPDRVPSSCLIM